ncbi:MAG: tail fiber domain-containing protein [Bacteroidales bacterium]|nr:tail fiber domain-containing protein [Bacteroidales bacterium]
MNKCVLFAILLFVCSISYSQIKVDNNGKVGINCSSPLERLQIGDRFTIHNGVSKVIGYNFYWDGSNSKRIISDEVSLLKFEPNGDIKFSFAGSGSAGSTITSFTEGFVFLNNGNAILGGATEYGKLNVKYNSTVITAYADHSSDWGYGIVSLVNRINTKAIVVKHNLNDRFIIYGDGDTWAYDYTKLSDISLKENIEAIDSPLEKVLQLNGIYYTYKVPVLSEDALPNTVISDEIPKRYMGFIAQEVEETVPEVVNTNENGIKGIAYQDLVALLVEAIKELEAQLTTLRYEVDNCCNSIEPQNKNQDTNGNKGNIEDCYLLQNQPNPFNSVTVISYFVPIENASASMLFFDMNGKLILTKNLDINADSLRISSGELMPGMYFYTLIVNSVEVDTKKMILTN